MINLFSPNPMQRPFHAFVTFIIDCLIDLLLCRCSLYKEHIEISQNSIRMLTITRKLVYITPIVRYLHLVPVNFKVDFRLLLLVFKILNSQDLGSLCW